MAYSITFPTSGPICSSDQLAEWLTERGEAYEHEGDHGLRLRALPVRFDTSPDQSALRAHLDIEPDNPLSRLVDVLFDVSNRAHADVNLTGRGSVTRASLWLELADEQDRLRVAAALIRARAMGHGDDLYRRLWAIVAALRADHDNRWDMGQERIVELVEVGDDIPLEDAQSIVADCRVGDVLPVPVAGWLHSLAWRWLSEAYPGIAEREHTLH